MFGVFLWLCGLAVVFVVIMTQRASRKQQKQREEVMLYFRRFYTRHGVPVYALQNEAFLPRSQCINGGGVLMPEYLYGCWKTGNIVKFLCYERNACVEVNEDDIKCYNCMGEEHYYTEVSGGGGGGSSLGGAVVGGLIGGSTGAVIGSRKKTDPITTKVNYINDKYTVVYIEHDEKKQSFTFKGNEVYNTLLSVLPEKEISVAGYVNKETKSDDVMQRLEKLNALYESRSITKDEYEQKRKEIVDSI